MTICEFFQIVVLFIQKSISKNVLKWVKILIGFCNCHFQINKYKILFSISSVSVFIEYSYEYCDNSDD